jgi:hypothetical protein
MTTTRRRIARLLATTAVGGALVAGAATTASAATSTDAPPAQSFAAPAASGVAAVGDAGQDYWGSDACHYFLQGGTWWSDMCMSAILDPAGNVVPNVISDFQNLGDGQLGREVLRMDFGTPSYVAAAQVTDVVGTWVWFPLTGSSPSTPVPPPAAQAPVYDTDYDMSAKGQTIRGLQNLANQTNTVMVNAAMGIPTFTFISAAGFRLP